MRKTTTMRRVLRAFNTFTLTTLNAPRPADSPYTTQGGRAFAGTRVF